MSDPLPVDLVTEVKGFDFDGEAQCLPQPNGAACIPRADAVETACLAERGTVLICQDCSRLCSEPL